HVPAFNIESAAGGESQNIEAVVEDSSLHPQGFVLSSPEGSVAPSAAIQPSRTPSTAPERLSRSFRPFDRRFTSRLSTSSSSGNSHSRPSSPAFLSGHNRNVSMTSQFMFEQLENESQSPPWEVVRWTKLKKISNQAFSETGRRNFGSPTFIAVASSIFVGTSKGLILMFDYSQNLKTIIGSGTKAVECGPITSIAISADHSTIAGGHTDGSIFTWETSTPTRPFLSIPPLNVPVRAERHGDGHVPGVSVLHIGFLGTRRTALVSADDRGMAFSHLASRGTGALGRTVKTTRILGRYPDAPLANSSKPLKPSTVLAFAPLPLGNAERATDTMGLTAMLTPYLLVIVSTTPIAQTQHKAARPRDIQPHSTMCGCLAWFPAGKLKAPDTATRSDISKAKLVYCWSNILTVLDIDEIPADNPSKPSSLVFCARNRWRCEEPIVAVQWLSRSVITVLTITQRLIVIEDRSMRVTDAFDLIHKYIYHADLFSKQLHRLVEDPDDEETSDGNSMHGVVADAFYMSLKSFKGRFFLLSFNELSIGALSNWHDRLFALMTNGDYVASIKLAVSYYVGESDKLTVGLPEDAEIRHSMMSPKLYDLMTETLEHIAVQRHKNPDSVPVTVLKDFVASLFSVCEILQDTDFLFDTIYEWYDEHQHGELFLETLESYITEGIITAVPPVVMKALVNHYVSKGLEVRLEEMICHVNTSTLDLDQITSLCKEHGLYDALIYVWNKGLNDYITPLIDLLALLIKPESGKGSSVVHEGLYGINAVKMFPYLSFVLTGRLYRTGELLDEDTAARAKSELYWFLFSGNTIEWPRGSGKRFITCPGQELEPSFPYLRLIIQYDAPSFLSALNEAFEDSFLNESPDKQIGASMRGDLPEEQVFGRTVDRQYIVSILLELISPPEVPPSDTIYLDMFIARNLPKFPQYLIFPGSTLTAVLVNLCRFPSPDLTEDAQLSVEYLLSVYQPPDMDSVLPLFREAGFYRILKRIYKANKQFGLLVDICFEDAHDQHAVFTCISEALRSRASLNAKQVQDIFNAVRNHAKSLVQLDAVCTAQTLAEESITLHKDVLHAVEDLPTLQYAYLQALLEPSATQPVKLHSELANDQDITELYIRLMCSYDPRHVSDYISILQTSDLHLDTLLETMEETGVIEAAVILMAHNGQFKNAMDRLIKHMSTLQVAIGALLAEGDNSATHQQTSIEEILQSLKNFTQVGIWLCNLQQKACPPTIGRSALGHRQQSMLQDEKLNQAEESWLSLIEASVKITKSITFDITECSASSINLDKEKLLTQTRALVQQVFTALLSTSADVSGNAPQRLPAEGNAIFLKILRVFLSNAAKSSPNLTDLQTVLASIFSAYAYEESILKLSSRLLSESLFVRISESYQLRQRGWRPRSSACEACGKRLWGPGIFGDIYSAWEEKQARDKKRQRQSRAKALGLPEPQSKGKSHVKSDSAEDCSSDEIWPSAPTNDDILKEAEVINSQAIDISDGMQQATQSKAQRQPLDDKIFDNVVLFSCRHIFHHTCLERIQDTQRHRNIKSHGTGTMNDGFMCPLHI
ncbi:hypothetical protein TD95_004071, partial [Thielaviopsis punctulata]